MNIHVPTFELYSVTIIVACPIKGARYRLPGIIMNNQELKLYQVQFDTLKGLIRVFRLERINIVE